MSEQIDTKIQPKSKRTKTKKDKPIKEKIEKEPKIDKIYDNYKDCVARLLTISIMR